MKTKSQPRNSRHEKLLTPAAFALVLALTLWGWGGAAKEAFAHAFLDKSNPSDGAVVKPGQDRIEMEFTADMRLTLVRIESIENASQVAIGELPKSFVKSAQITTQPLLPGAYRVNWIGIGKDGHIMKGNFSFSVAAGE